MKIIRRAGISLTEVLVLMVLISIFLVAVFQTFNVIQTTMQTNRMIVDRLYLEANIENFFTILHDELRWGGSMTDYLTLLGDTNIKPTSLNIVENASSKRLETHYAGAEKVILKKLSSYPGFSAANPQEVTDELISLFGHDSLNPDQVFFALFPTEIPTPTLHPPGSNGWWLIHSNDPVSPSSVDLLKSIYTLHPATITTRVSPLATESGIAAEINQALSDYVFIIFHEGPGNPIPGSSFKGLSTSSGMYWGEQIAQSAIVWDKNSKRLSLEKYIPTVSTANPNTINLLLLEDVVAFYATTTTLSGDRMVLRVEVSCDIPNPYDPRKAGMIFTKTRNFWFWEGR